MQIKLVKIGHGAKVHAGYKVMEGGKPMHTATQCDYHPFHTVTEIEEITEDRIEKITCGKCRKAIEKAIEFLAKKQELEAAKSNPGDMALADMLIGATEAPAVTVEEIEAAAPGIEFTAEEIQAVADIVEATEAALDEPATPEAIMIPEIPIMDESGFKVADTAPAAPITNTTEEATSMYNTISDMGTLTVKTFLGTFVIDTEAKTCSLNGHTPRPLAKLGYDGQIRKGRRLWMVLADDAKLLNRNCGHIQEITLEDEGEAESVCVSEQDNFFKPDSSAGKGIKSLAPAQAPEQEKAHGEIIPELKAVLADLGLVEEGEEEGGE